MQQPAADQPVIVPAPDGRLLIAVLDPTSTATTSPLRRALAHPRTAPQPPTTSDKEA
ncbi:hypothetical protein HUT19_42010 (plasmid) [Streptomyces sp. NA02950]|uniref:hypothetical protein n=1 Tax=Streptomyces sp. NA02950 TaxID=2742137 RepID=UPI00159085E8|nr:hypothetical protein [Streptomyces sp. NA02950]QKV98294.1 hypothetical protein HUT19_42010 [Streptomyces sp. NA02950]